MSIDCGVIVTDAQRTASPPFYIFFYLVDVDVCRTDSIQWRPLSLDVLKKDLSPCRTRSASAARQAMIDSFSNLAGSISIYMYPSVYL